MNEQVIGIEKNSLWKNKKNGQVYKVINTAIDCNNTKYSIEPLDVIYELAPEMYEGERLDKKIGLIFTRNIDEFLNKFTFYGPLADRIIKSAEYYKDFPKPGVSYIDLINLIRDPDLRGDCLSELNRLSKSIVPDCDAIIGLEARGFYYGMSIANDLGVSFIPARKKDKLPGAKVSKVYDLEYGRDTIQLQKKSLEGIKRVIIHDDILATGGTALALAQLLMEQGIKVVGYIFLGEITSLKGRQNLFNNIALATNDNVLSLAKF